MKITDWIVDDWKQAWTWISMWGGLAVAAWGALPEQYQEAILRTLGASQDTLLTIAGLGIMLGRIIAQSRKPAPPDA